MTDFPTKPYAAAFATLDDKGLSIREYFAVHIYAGLLASRPLYRGPQETNEELRRRIACASVASADFLIEALNAPVAVTTGREDDGQPE